MGHREKCRRYFGPFSARISLNKSVKIASGKTVAVTCLLYVLFSFQSSKKTCMVGLCELQSLHHLCKQCSPSWRLAGTQLTHQERAAKGHNVTINLLPTSRTINTPNSKTRNCWSLGYQMPGVTRRVKWKFPWIRGIVI